jgi:hypothetical protein
MENKIYQGAKIDERPAKKKKKIIFLLKLLLKLQQLNGLRRRLAS